MYKKGTLLSGQFKTYYKKTNLAMLHVK